MKYTQNWRWSQLSVFKHKSFLFKFNFRPFSDVSTLSLPPPSRDKKACKIQRASKINWINNAIQRHPLLIAVRWRFFTKKFTKKFCALEFPLVRNPLLSSLSTRNDLLKTIKYELNFFSATSDPYLFFPNLINCFLALPPLVWLWLPAPGNGCFRNKRVSFHGSKVAKR